MRVHRDLVLGGVTDQTLFSEKETYEGVVRLPWSLAIISTWSFCQTPTHLEKISQQRCHRMRAQGEHKQVCGAEINTNS